MKVLHVCWDLGQGGIQRYIIDLLSVHKNKVVSRIMVLSRPGELSEDASDLSDRVDYIGMKNGFDLWAFFSILKILRSSDHDVIHAHANNVIFNLALAFQSKPVVYTEHGGRFLTRDIASHIQYKYLSKNIDRFIAISHFMDELMCERNPKISDRTRVIYNGINCQDSVGSGSSEETKLLCDGLPKGPKVGFIGRLVPEKGGDLFIETARLVNECLPDAHFIVIGDGPDRVRMQELVQKYGIEERVIFLGFRKDARGILDTLDVLLMTSRVEAFGLAIVEAMAAGVPVVAMYNHSAVAEILRDKIDGFVVEGLNPVGAAECVIGLLSDSEQRGRMGASAMKRALEFSIESNGQQVAEQYLELVGHG
jgi:glycosyltransferase involved in cell wall biosynthesis